MHFTRGRDFDPPGFEVLAVLVGGTTREAAPVVTPLAAGAGRKENVPPEEAHRQAEAAALAARNAENEAAGAAKEELAVKAGLAEAEKTVAHAAAECIAAEEALVRERRGVKGPPK